MKYKEIALKNDEFDTEKIISTLKNEKIKILN